MGEAATQHFMLSGPGAVGAALTGHTDPEEPHQQVGSREPLGHSSERPKAIGSPEEAAVPATMRPRATSLSCFLCARSSGGSEAGTLRECSEASPCLPCPRGPRAELQHEWSPSVLPLSPSFLDCQHWAGPRSSTKPHAALSSKHTGQRSETLLRGCETCQGTPLTGSWQRVHTTFSQNVMK